MSSRLSHLASGIILLITVGEAKHISSSPLSVGRVTEKVAQSLRTNSRRRRLLLPISCRIERVLLIHSRKMPAISIYDWKRKWSQEKPYPLFADCSKVLKLCAINTGSIIHERNEFPVRGMQNFHSTAFQAFYSEIKATLFQAVNDRSSSYRTGSSARPTQKEVKYGKP